MCQLRSDSLTPLFDLGFAVIPPLTAIIWPSSSYFTNLSDIWLLGTIGIFILLVLPFCVKRPWLTTIRFAWCLAVLFALRALTLLATVYPLTPQANPPYLTPNVALGAVLVLFGVRTTASDYMFSGHTALFILSATLFWQYRKRGPEWVALSLLYWVVCVTGIVLLIGVRMHYTGDVVMATIIALLVATLYYVVAVQKRDSWVHALVDWCEK
jgi:hypothetical protein